MVPRIARLRIKNFVLSLWILVNIRGEKTQRLDNAISNLKQYLCTCDQQLSCRVECRVGPVCALITSDKFSATQH